MKIICDSQEEYDELMKASRYLHDFTVWVTNKKGETEIEETGSDETLVLKNKNEIIGYSLDFDVKMVNFLVGLYLDKDDFPNKDEIVIKNFE